jgi:carbamoyl-phosphate synthase large subunit
MPLDKTIKRAMVIGSGPIVIGQGAEFDYAGTQACRALKEDGIAVILVNSNPATIMTDTAIADKIYIEPITLETVKRIIAIESPDCILSTLGGQNALTICMQLARSGFLEETGVRLLGSSPEAIDMAEDRYLFKETMLRIGQPVIPSAVVNEAHEALAFAKTAGFPLIVRPAFTLGGTGGGYAQDEEELEEIVKSGLRFSPIRQCLIEKSVAGFKEIEFEVIRDAEGNTITVCSMENLDPVGVHTGDSIVVAPAVTLADKEYQMLRSASIDIINELGVEGGCNVQFALDPESREYAVIEVNPRVSRSSALASKATGYPIAKTATKIAIGYRLDEIKNAVTSVTYACFEPALDYVVVKFPKWPFDKFVYAKRTIGTQMKATGEVMAIGQTFEEALMKAVRGAEIGLDSLSSPKFAALSDAQIVHKLGDTDDERLFLVYEAIKRGVPIEEIHRQNAIDEWFLAKLKNLAALELEIAQGPLSMELYRKAKKNGFPDTAVLRLSGASELPFSIGAAYKMVDTCAAEFEARTPYFYSACGEEDEAAPFKEEKAKDGKKTVVVFGSGPIRIGQGIEFDYASVHCVWALKKLGYDVAIVNNNPETVSTDFDTADRLYFEPVTPEDAMRIIEIEKPFACVVAFGGQTSIKLTKELARRNIPILGTSADSIDRAEDRERFDALMEELNIKRPRGYTVMDKPSAIEMANKVGYPVLLRPSYVLGGQNMIIAYSDEDVDEYMDIILAHGIENPVLVDKYLMGDELEVDAICDGTDILVPGVMQHIERSGIHSGDSIAVYPSWSIPSEMIEEIVASSKRIALSLNTLGLVNIQYLVFEGDLYVIEVNPRASRTVPYLSKVTGIPMVEVAVRAMLGEKLRHMGYGVGLFKSYDYFAVKAPVFSFEKLAGLDTQLGPEMKSTGEVLGIAHTRQEAIFKALTARGENMGRKGGVFLSVRNSDKGEIAGLARRFADFGFALYATEGTASVLAAEGLECVRVRKLHEALDGYPDSLSLIEEGKLAYVVSTSSKGRLPTRDSVIIRSKAVECRIPCLTSIDTAYALVSSLECGYTEKTTNLVDINRIFRRQ